MCGSGTLLIEGGLLATGQPPGAQRTFAFMGWPRYRPGLWQALLAEAARDRRPLGAFLQGSDHSDAALAAARRNAERSGLADIDWQLRELAFLPSMAGSGLLICNPPYGERLGAGSDLRPLYRQLGQICRRSLPGWRVAILSPDERLVRTTGLPMRRIAALNNGGIAVALYTSEQQWFFRLISRQSSHKLPSCPGNNGVLQICTESEVIYLEIQVVDNNVEKAIRVLKRKLQQEGLFREMKQRKFYEKPSVKRKRKEKEAQRRLRKKLRLMKTD
jgi:ribosomal protein S21